MFIVSPRYSCWQRVIPSDVLTRFDDEDSALNNACKVQINRESTAALVVQL